MKRRTPVRQNALAFWTPKAGRRSENRPKAIRVNLSGRAIFLSKLDRLRDFCGVAKHLISNPTVGKSLSRKFPAVLLQVYLSIYEGTR